MGNHGSREGNRQEVEEPRRARQWPRSADEPSSLLDCMSSFQELCVETGRTVLGQLMEEERLHHRVRTFEALGHRLVLVLAR